MLKSAVRFFVLPTLIVGISLAAFAAGEKTQPRRVVVLDTAGLWRMHHTLKPPVVQTDKGLKILVWELNFGPTAKDMPPLIFY